MPPLARAVAQALGGELLGVAAAFDEGLLEGVDLLVEQVVGLVDQADHGIRPHSGFSVFQPRGVERPAFWVGEIRQI